MSASNPVTYAEQELGVHKVYEDALAAQVELDALAASLDEANDSRRYLLDMIADREVELLDDERAKHASQSATWLKEHMKSAERKDAKLTELRGKMMEIDSTRQGLDYDYEVCKSKLRLLEARMNQLGGYLNYLAAVKQASTERLRRQANPQA